MSDLPDQLELLRIPGSAAASIVVRLIRGLDRPRGFGRDVEDLLRDFENLPAEAWPVDPTPSAIVAAYGLFALGGWTEKTEARARSLPLLTERCLLRLHASLASVPGEVAAQLAAPLLSAWGQTTVVRKEILLETLVEQAPPELHEALLLLVGDEVSRRGRDFSRLAGAAAGAGASPPARQREQALLAARIHACRGDFAAAAALLEREPISDPRVLDTSVKVLLAQGLHNEAIERVARGILLSDDKRLLRDQLVELLLDVDDIQGAVDQLMVQIDESGDLTYWHILRNVLLERAPDSIADVREALRTRAPSTFVEILIEEQDFDELLRISQLKSFTYEQLWQLGDALAEQHPDEASRLYERAVQVHGALAVTRVLAGEFVRRVEAIIPFFERLGKPTKPRRMAREVLAMSKNPGALKVELPKLFGDKL